LDAEKDLETRLNRRAALTSLAMGVGGLAGLVALHQKLPRDGSGVPKLFRGSHERNEAVARALLAPSRGQDREFPASTAVQPRNNYHGGTPEIDTDAWRLDWQGRKLTLGELQKLPHVTQTTELKCVEGWSAVVTWTGARFADFLKAFPDTASYQEEPRYVSLRSEPEGWEDDWYYVGIDLESMRHPQTLLAWAMNGQPLTADHGAPLRLVIPHKYGIKNIKLITSIALSETRPADYWADQGYDWYAGL
jgi:DMSO/TMAO reductase YedYZ molybdopterin-dependent catalytic subunit